MSAIQPGDITWIVSTSARTAIAPIRTLLGTNYDSSKNALQQLLCDYFNAGECLGRQGKTIAPIECDVAHAKGLKVRWVAPGSGKSGGLRIAFLVYCDTRKVILAGAWMRRDDPSDADFAAAFSSTKA